MIRKKLRFGTLALLAIAAISLLVVAGCAMASVSASHDEDPRPTREPRPTRTPEPRSYLAYLNEDQLTQDSVEVDGTEISIDPRPRSDGTFPSDTTITLQSAQDMTWAGDCGNSYVGTTCSVVMDQDRYVKVTQVPPPTQDPPAEDPPPADDPPAEEPPASDPPPVDEPPPADSPPAVAPLPNFTYPAEGQVFTAYISNERRIQVQTEPYAKPLWYYLQTYTDGMTIDANGLFRWSPDPDLYSDRIGTRFQATLWITDEPPGSGSNRNKYRTIYFDLIEEGSSNPPPTEDPPADDPPPAGDPPAGDPPAPDPDPCASASLHQESSFFFVSFVHNLLGIKPVYAQECVEDPDLAAINALYECIGGSNSWLGKATGGPYTEASTGKPRQDFQNGYIAWNGAQFYTFSNRIGDTFLAPFRPVCVQQWALGTDQRSIAKTYNRIGAGLKMQLEPFASTNDQLQKITAVALGVWWVESVAEGPFGGPILNGNAQPTIRLEQQWFFNVWIHHPYRDGLIATQERNRRYNILKATSMIPKK
ncbi:MAG TPA: hypothetical protein VGA53_01280 [Candidatus Paceibacterota bacterium]